MGMFVGIVIAIWAGSFLLWYMLSNVFKTADADKIKSRVMGITNKQNPKAAAKGPALFSPDDAPHGKMAMKLLKKLQGTDKLRDLIEQAGLRWNVARTVHACLALFLLGYAIGYFGFPGLFEHLAWLLGLVLGVSPLLYLKKKRARWLHKFEEIFPESLEFVARSMRAGHAFSVSLEMIHREFQEPLAGEFRRAFDEHNLGLPLDAALEKLARRVPLLDVHFFVSAVLLQKRTGGILAEILDKLAYVIRERFKLRGKIQAISAHGRMTGIALTCIPIGVAVLLFLTNPDYVKFFVLDETGQLMLAAAVGFQIIGYLVIRKIVQIEV
jgi:tight adherence protein B